jgi:hypothetical protein
MQMNMAYFTGLPGVMARLMRVVQLADDHHRPDPTSAAKTYASDPPGRVRQISDTTKREGNLGPAESIAAAWGPGIGAEIMGRNKFRPATGPWPDDGWLGWWGEEPVFRTPAS